MDPSIPALIRQQLVAFYGTMGGGGGGGGGRIWDHVLL
ncbi:hypothetical protein LINPERHAP2_LOCUS59 [Linum perenne]